MWRLSAGAGASADPAKRCARRFASSAQSPLPEAAAADCPRCRGCRGCLLPQVLAGRGARRGQLWCGAGMHRPAARRRRAALRRQIDQQGGSCGHGSVCEPAAKYRRPAGLFPPAVLKTLHSPAASVAVAAAAAVQVPKNARATPRYLLKIQTEVDAMQQLGGSLDAVFLQVRAGGGRCCWGARVLVGARRRSGADAGGGGGGGGLGLHPTPRNHLPHAHVSPPSSP